MTAEWNDIVAQHWEGGALDCARCEHAGLHEQGGCAPGRICMQDASARRIDRFFRTHHELANQHLGHVYFEVLARFGADAEPEIRERAGARLAQLPSAVEPAHG